MGIITDLIKQKHDQDWKKKEAEVDALQAVLTHAPTDEAREWAVQGINQILTGQSKSKSGGGGSNGKPKELHPLAMLAGGLSKMAGAINPFTASQGTKRNIADVESRRPQQLTQTGDQQQAQIVKIAQAEDQAKQAAELKRQQALEEQKQAAARKDRQERLSLLDEEHARGNVDDQAYKVIRARLQFGEQNVPTPSQQQPRVKTPAEQSREDELAAYATKKGKKVEDLTPQERIEATAKPEKPTAGTLGELEQARKDLRSGDPDKVAAAKEFIAKYNRPSVAVINQKEAKDEAADILEGIKSGNISPDLKGLARGGLMGQVLRLAAKDKYPLLQAQNDLVATRRWLNTQNSASQIRLKQATEFASESLDLLDNPEKPGDDLIGKLASAVPRTKFPIVNKAALTAAKNGLFGEEAAEAARNIENQVTDLQSEIALVYKGGNSPTDIGLKQAQKILDTDWSDKTLRSAINLARKNLQIRLNSIKNVGPAGLSGGQGQGQGGQGGGQGQGDSLKKRRFNPSTGEFEDIK
jgi:hypothetical protein